MRVLLSSSSLFSLGGLRGGVERLALGIVCRLSLGVVLISLAHAEDWERYVSAKKWPEAIVALKGELTRRPEDLLLHEKLATALVYGKRREEALRWLARAVEREPSAARKSALIRRLRIVSRTFVEDATFQVFQAGTNALQRGDLPKAQASFLQALTREPDNIEILVRLAQVHLLLGDADSAVEKLRTASALNPYESETLLALGDALIHRDEVSEGLKWVQKAKASAPDCGGCARIQALGLEKSGNLDGALAALDEALRKRGHRAELFLMWARIALKREATPAQLARMKREFEDLFHLSSEEPVGESAIDATQFRAGQDLSLNRVAGRIEQRAQRAEAMRLLKQIESFEKTDADS